MRAAPVKHDCVICIAPELIRRVVDIAIWPEGGIVRSANYRSAGARAASQAAMSMPPVDGKEDPRAARYSELDPKTITRHADHIEESWREFEPGETLRPDEVVIATDFGSVTEQMARVGMLAAGGLSTLIGQDPVRFAALFPKEAIAASKLGLQAAGVKEASRLKRNQQVIDVAAIFAASSGHHRPVDSGGDEDEASLDDLRGELAEERKQLAARAG